MPDGLLESRDRLAPPRSARRGHAGGRRGQTALVDPARGQDVGGVGRVRPPAPDVVDGGVVGDPEHPGRRLPVGAPLVQGAERLDEGVLGEVFGELPVADEPVDEAEDAGPVASHQLAAGVLPALPRTGHHLAVGGRGEIGGGAHGLVVVVHGRSLRPLTPVRRRGRR